MYTEETDLAALDRHITGNWGEDSVDDSDERCEDCDQREECPWDGCYEECAQAEADDRLDELRDIRMGL